MATRKIIRIDEAKCTGCGNCITDCAEGALKLVNGKAKLVKEQFCDGFGDCMKGCPTGALTIEERPAEDFDVNATKQHVRTTLGEAAVRRMEEAAKVHERKANPPAHTPQAHAGGCPGSRMRFDADRKPAPATPTQAGNQGHMLASDLEQWPVQLHLVQPGAPFFKNRELVVLSTCAPVASADVHWRFLRGRGVVVACPKLDDTSPYVAKLAAILSEPTLPKVMVVRMQVPCCGGLTAILQEALHMSGRTDLKAEEVTVGLNGDVLASRTLAG